MGIEVEAGPCCRFDAGPRARHQLPVLAEQVVHEARLARLYEESAGQLPSLDSPLVAGRAGGRPPSTWHVLRLQQPAHS